jgi:superfamily II DNA or RNA helicase
LEDKLDSIRVLIVDEVHDMVSDTAKEIYKKMKNTVIRIGLSAPPFKHGETDKVHKYLVKGFFGPIITTTTTSTGRVTTADLQQKGRLSQSKCLFYKICEPDLSLSIYSEAIDLGIVNNLTLHNKVVELTNAFSGRTLILVDRIAHGDQLKKMIPTAYWITGKDDNDSRKEVINMLQSSKTSCIAIATQQIFNTGINVKIHNLINAAGGQADHLIIQRMGRGLRTADDKKEVTYIDFMFENNPYLKKHSAKRVRILEKEGHSLQFFD